jgi:hypothetical protein
MNTRGLVELVALNIGYDLGILPPRIFAMMVLMALVTTFLTGPLLNLAERAKRRGAPAVAASKDLANSLPRPSAQRGDRIDRRQKQTRADPAFAGWPDVYAGVRSPRRGYDAARPGHCGMPKEPPFDQWRFVGRTIRTTIMQVRAQTTKIWSAVTRHRFGRVQRPGEESRMPLSIRRR